jgi:TP901 family phage tail tape measure protein
MAIEAARLTVVVDAATDAAERGLDRVGDRVSHAGGLVRDVAGTAFGFLSAQAVMGAGAAGAAMFRLGVETQDAMNVFQSVTGATGDTMARVSGLARDLGNDLSLPGTSAKDATLAMVELAKAGLSVDQTMAAAKGTLQLAAAAGTDAGTAAQITANALNAFGLSGDKAGKVADLLAAAANSSSGEITDMAYAMQMSSAVFKMGNQDIESLTTSIGLMANKGILGSDAGTSLKTMMLSLQAPTGKANKLLQEMGISVRDSAGHMRPMRDLVEQFTRATSKMGDAERDKALKTIFGTDAIRAAQIVMTGGVEAYDAMSKAVTRQGAAQEVAAARMKGVGGAIEGLKSQVETVLIDAFNKAAPTMERVVRALSDGLPKAIDVAARAFGVVRELVNSFVMGLQGAPNEIGGLSQAINLIGFRVREVVQTVQEHWPQIRATIAEVLAGVQEVIGAVIGWVGEHWPEISRIISSVIDTVVAIVSAGLDLIASFWRTWGGTITALAQDAWHAVTQIIEGALSIIRGVIDVVMGLIHGDWGRVWDGISAIVSGAWEVINGLIDAALGALRTVIEVGMRLIAGAFDAAWDGIKGGVSASIGFVRDTVTGGFDRLVDFVSGLPSRVATAAGGMWDGIGDSFKTVINRVIGWWNDLSFPTFHLPEVDLGPLGSIGGGSFGGWHMPQIPYLAAGGMAKGWAVVGERGPELAYFGSDARVFSNRDSRAMVAGSGGTTNLTINVGSVRSNRDVDRIAAAVTVSVTRTQVGRRLATDARGMGY